MKFVAVLVAAFVCAASAQSITQMASMGALDSVTCAQVTATGDWAVVNLKNSGEACNEDSQVVGGKLTIDMCSAGYSCWTESATSSAKKCKPVKRMGDACASDWDCTDPNFGSGDQKCFSSVCHIEDLSAGDDCVDASQCGTNTCTDGKCTVKATGEACTDHEECAKNSICMDSKCAERKANGATCAAAEECMTLVCIQKDGESALTCQDGQLAAGTKVSSVGVGSEWSFICAVGTQWDAASSTCKAMAPIGTVEDGAECTASTDCKNANSVCSCIGSGKAQCKSYKDLTSVFRDASLCQYNKVKAYECNLGAADKCEGECSSQSLFEESTRLGVFVATGEDGGDLYNKIIDNAPSRGGAGAVGPSAVALLGAAVALFFARE